jgi:predicted nuclease with TOPRIM domain
MAIRPVPPTGSDSPGTAVRRDRSFAALYEQARRAAANDTGEQDREEAREQSRNRRTLEELHERVDTVRGELLVRVIQSAQSPREQVGRYTGDISRLASRLDTLREKLKSEENRLSGKVFDQTV